jgi:hypothetical protein
MILKILSAKNLAKNLAKSLAKNLAKNLAKILAFFVQPTARFCKNLIITLIFEKNANFFAENWQKITKNCDHNIDLRTQPTTFEFTYYYTQRKAL